MVRETTGPFSVVGKTRSPLGVTVITGVTALGVTVDGRMKNLVFAI